ncbi:MAG: polyprenyl synthetase family protein [Balneolaceae bacterium]|nr:polyprenyl synthetase family protein [Balneolaceae bacterium]
MSTSKLQHNLIETIEGGLRDLDIPESPQTLYEPYIYAIGVGGKRIRPLLTLLSCGLCKGNIKYALPAALAIEILHNFTLVHDDIMDSADTRRGKPSVFSKWNENIAILSGDVMFADAYRQIGWYGTHPSFSKDEFADIHKIFLDAVVTVCEGQALDMEFVGRTSVSHQEYIHMISGKTAALLAGAFEIGAITAHASNAQRKKLHNIGIELGIAFQMQDDLLDATADPEKFGKRPGGDIFEGKKTYLTILTLERTETDDAAFINQVLKSSKPKEKDVNQVLQIMEANDVLHDVEQEIAKHYDNVMHLLRDFDPSEYKQELVNLFTFLKERDH